MDGQISLSTTRQTTFQYHDRMETADLSHDPGAYGKNPQIDKFKFVPSQKYRKLI